MNATPAKAPPDPRAAQVFRFVRCSYADGAAELVYAFDAGPELVESIRFPEPPALPETRRAALDAALRFLHLVAGVSYYKAGVPGRIAVETGALDDATAGLLDALYLHGLAEFAYRNGLDLHGKIAFPHGSPSPSGNGRNPDPGKEKTLDPSPRRGDGKGGAIGLPHRVLVPIGGGKDSLVVVEALKAHGIDATAAWVGGSPLIAGVAARTGLPMLNIGRELSPVLFEYNRMGAWNGHIPVTAINSAILACAAVLYGFDAIAFANERSASAATLEYAGRQVNHQWSKGWVFERLFADWLRSHVAADLDYFSLLRPYPELAVTRAFAKSGVKYFDVFSSCNRNFRILGPKPADRWCGQCPKCHFVFLALAPFLPKPRLLKIFGRNLLDDETLAAGFDALIEYHDHKPFECVGEAAEARAALAALAARPEWREDALVARFREEIAPHLDGSAPGLEPWLAPSGEHGVPARFGGALDAIRGA
ncbi:MAG TPA: UDP-N-acetyl-alpha-D-muramoyl-L-alanyl-L-glutamate epimerase [Rhodanobacteraceae bacterium]|nr:UDP-N-acetyl-alpha-D-muramoyl-L-alanyl-L-glutamate epimerase [Rhodanobacteraceae bacterium]